MKKALLMGLLYPSIGCDVTDDKKDDTGTATTAARCSSNAPATIESLLFTPESPVGIDRSLSVAAEVTDEATAFAPEITFSIGGQDFSMVLNTASADPFLYALTLSSTDLQALNFITTSSPESFAYEISILDDCREYTTSTGAYSFLDTLPPTLSSLTQTSTPDPATNSSSTIVEISATFADVWTGVDPTAAYIVLNENGQIPLSAYSADTFTTTLTGDQLANTTGTYQANYEIPYALYVTDRAGNESVFDGYSIEVEDETGLYFSSLTTDPTTAGNDISQTVTITLNATDYQDGQNITALCDVDSYPVPLTFTSGTTYQGTFYTSNFTTWPVAGTKGVSCTIEDLDGYTATQSVPFDLRDVTNPEVECEQVGTASNSGTDDLEIRCTPNDKTGLASNPVSWANATYGSGTATDNGDGTYSIVIDATTLEGNPAGIETFEITAQDAAGNETTISVDALIRDLYDPIVSCGVSPSELGNNLVSSTLSATVSDETAMGETWYSWEYGEDLLGTGDGTFSTTITASPGIPAGDYTVTVTAYDANGNTEECTTTLTVTDNVGPTINKLYVADATSGERIAENADGIQSIVNDGSQSYYVVLCANDETDGTEIGGAITVTLDSLLFSTWTYNATTECFESASQDASVHSEGTYTISARAADAAGNSSTANSELEVTCSGVTIENISITYESGDGVAYNNNSGSAFTVCADFTEGSCSSAVDYNTLQATVESVTTSLTESSDPTYCGTFDAYTNAATIGFGTETISVTGSDEDGNSRTDTSATVEIGDICDNLPTDAADARYGFYVNGSLTAYQNRADTSWSAAASSIDALRVGSYGTAFEPFSVVNYDGAFTEILDYSTCDGGTLGSSYTTRTWENCLFAQTYDTTAATFSVSWSLDNTESNTEVQLYRTSPAGSGFQIFETSGVCYPNDGAGVTGSAFACPGTGVINTSCVNP